MSESGKGAIAPFYRLQGKRMIALVFVFVTYAIWFIGPGYFGQMTAIEGHMSLQKSVYYSGQVAVDRLCLLDTDERRLKYLALIFDIPFMILYALIFEAFIAFGLRARRQERSKWGVLLGLPIICLLIDFSENSFIALALASGNTYFGTLAGYSPL